MKEIDPTLLDRELQRGILRELESKNGIGVIASQLEATVGALTDKQYANIRYLQLKGYLTLDKIPAIGSNYALEDHILLKIALDGRRFLHSI